MPERVTRTRQQRLHRGVRVEAAPQHRIVDEREIETGVKQQPAAVAVQQDTGHRLEEPLAGRGGVQAHRLGQSLVAERQRDDRPDTCSHPSSRSSSCRLRPGVQPADSLAMLRLLGAATTWADTTPLSHGWATMKSSWLTRLSQQPVAPASSPPEGQTWLLPLGSPAAP